MQKQKGKMIVKIKYFHELSNVIIRHIMLRNLSLIDI